MFKLKVTIQAVQNKFIVRSVYESVQAGSKEGLSTV